MIPAHDLLAKGAAYANTAWGFKNFQRDNCKVTNLRMVHGEKPSFDMDLNEYANHDLGGNVDLDINDLPMDDEEFPTTTDIADFAAMTQEVIEKLSRYD